MKIIRDSDSGTIDACVLTTGAFDGVHRGHQMVINEVKRRANERGVLSAIVTFDVHPALVVRPSSVPQILTRLPRKLELLEQLGIDVVYVVEFDENRAGTRAADFIQEVFVDRLNAVEILVGSDFHFGKGREGTLDFLTEQGKLHGFTVDGLELLRASEDATEPLSSTAIRRALVGGDVELAAEILGRPYEIHGTVTEGQQRGRTLGFPTANVVLPEGKARPANGVYACWYVTEDGVERPAAVNIGVRPTFDDSGPEAILEAHILDFSGDLYGQTGRVKFVRFLRSERRFDGIEDLKAQLEVDIANTREAVAGD